MFLISIFGEHELLLNRFQLQWGNFFLQNTTGPQKAINVWITWMVALYPSVASTVSVV